MEERICIRCGKPDPQHTLRYFAVNQVSHSTTQYSGRKKITTTLTNESIAGAERINVCNRCIKRKRLLNSLECGLAVFICVIIFCAIIYFYCTSSKKPDDPKDFYILFLVLAAVSAVITFIVTMARKTPFVGALVLKKVKGKEAENITYVPADPYLYFGKDKTHVSLDVFKNKSGLKTEIGDELFIKFISPGIGNEAVDAIIEADKAKAQEELNNTGER